jgi:hypothetical protein
MPRVKSTKQLKSINGATPQEEVVKKKLRGAKKLKQVKTLRRVRG